MPSQLHEVLLLLFRNRPELAPSLLREALHVSLPQYAEARIESADLTDVQPAEYRADLVVLLHNESPVLGIVVEVQLSPDERKHYAWPVYAVGLRARMRCPVCLLVITAQEAVAQWAARPIELGGNSWFVPFVVGPSGVPEVTDAERARQAPELAVLSALAHGQSADFVKAAQIGSAAMSASLELDEDRSVLYLDLVYAALGQAARRSLKAMDLSKYEFQTDFAKRLWQQRTEALAQARAEGLEAGHAEGLEAGRAAGLEAGRAEGLQAGRAEGLQAGRAEGLQAGRAEGQTEARVSMLAKLITLKFGAIDERVQQRLRSASADELDLWVERILSAATIDEVFR